jgi:GTP-binding protein HflX
VFNKIDQVDGETLRLAQEEFPLGIYISANLRIGLETLRHRVSQLIDYAVSSG